MDPTMELEQEYMAYGTDWSQIQSFTADHFDDLKLGMAHDEGLYDLQSAKGSPDFLLSDPESPVQGKLSPWQWPSGR